MRHYLRVLEVKESASWDEIKQAYRDLIRVWHPDRFENDPHLRAKAEQKTKQINHAYHKIYRFFQAHPEAKSIPPAPEHCRDGAGAAKESWHGHPRPSPRTRKHRFVRRAEPSRGIFCQVGRTLYLVGLSIVQSLCLLIAPVIVMVIVGFCILNRRPPLTLPFVSSLLPQQLGKVGERLENGIKIMSHRRDRDF